MDNSVRMPCIVDITIYKDVFKRHLIISFASIKAKFRQNLKKKKTIYLKTISSDSSNNFIDEVVL